MHRSPAAAQRDFFSICVLYLPHGLVFKIGTIWEIATQKLTAVYSWAQYDNWGGPSAPADWGMQSELSGGIAIWPGLCYNGSGDREEVAFFLSWLR